MDKLIELASTLVSGAVIAVLASWLTSRARNRQEQHAEIGALPVQADALTVAVSELQGAAAANRLLWEGPAERGRTFLLTVLAFPWRRSGPDCRRKRRAELARGLRARG
ncbi:hypothetical protein [Streptomyces sp. YS415]|uniref:hypothetical protein n=1 Tax=Streptomyces sp. YS415 TaxID=2944806 RepID=UPI0020205905|nr:hypothetical protein [Streptomyces sp. YS415]MCL7430526.1 hypothetical protein [Streptomyces sp. YS415]